MTGMIKSQDLDRRVTILKRLRVRNPRSGVDDWQWVPLATVWAQVQDVLPGRAKDLAEVIEIGKRPCRVRMRYRPGITNDMRISIAGRELAIISGPAELGRRKGLEIVAEELTAEGHRP